MTCKFCLPCNVHVAYILNMRLAAWMAKRRISDELLASELGVSRATVSRLRRGLQVPSMALAARISEFTKRRVTANDFLEEAQRRQAQAQSDAEGSDGIVEAAE